MKICLLDANTLGEDIDLSVFAKFGEFTSYQTTQPDEVVDRIRDQNIIITNKVVLNKENLSKAEDLKLVCITATGVNNIDLDYAKANGIAVTNVSGYSTQSVIQHTFAMLFYLYEHLREHDDYVRSGDYARSDLFTYLERPYSEIAGKTWGIIGLGTIGKAVAKIAEAFGCKLVYYSTSGKNKDEDFQRVELDELLRVSDIVSIHAPLNQDTYNLINADRLDLMKKSALLLNLGRGGIVNEGDLAKALDNNIIAGAALDVLEKEPIEADNPLLKVSDKNKLLITPHIAWASVEARNRLVQEVALNIEAYIDGQARNRVC